MVSKREEILTFDMKLGLLGSLLIIIGFVVQFEVRVVNSEEKEEINSDNKYK
tara:strand:- start:214 stop:369 length:156 start_codon:yes stop_codon:yes gene_type:complete